MAKVERLRFDENGKQIIKPTRYYSARQENTVAKNINGKVTKNSGATLFEKGDITTHNILIEAKTKTTKNNSVSIKRDWIDKNRLERVRMGKEFSAIVFNFGPNEENFYIIDEKMFKLLKEVID